MENYEKLLTHTFFSNLREDVDDLKSTNESSDEKTISEFKYYVNNTRLYSIHLMHLIGQLQDAIELFSNYDYKNNDEIGRGRHLTYNYENYLIRFKSLSDRVLQTINAVFHLGNDEKDVKERIILNNTKVAITEVPNHFRELKKVLINFDKGARNAIVHKHGYLDHDLIRLEKLYDPDLSKLFFENKSKEEIHNYREVRKYALTKFLKDKKLELKKNNELCYEEIIKIFSVLEKQYIKVKSIIK